MAERSIELRHLRYFIAVAEHANFSRAAEALGTAQPSLSQQIRALEAGIGVTLFDRSTRRIALTAAGTEFLAEARALLAQLDVAIAHARAAERGLRGELRIAYTFSAMLTELPSAIRAYRAGHPDVRIALSAQAPAALLDALRQGAADVGLLLVQPGTSRCAEIDMRPLGSLPLRAAVPAGHRLARRRAVTIEDIGDDPLVLFDRRLAGIYDAVLQLCRERGFVPARIEEVDRVETMLGLVAAGEGVSIVPQAYETLGFGGVAYMALTPAPEPFSIVVAQRKDKHSPLATAFVQTCRAVAAGR